MSGEYTQATVSWAPHIWQPPIGNGPVDELNLTMDGGCEMMIRWYDHRRHGSGIVPRFEAFPDGYPILLELVPLMAETPANMNLSPGDVIAFLDARGWKPSSHHGRLVVT